MASSQLIRASFTGAVDRQPCAPPNGSSFAFPKLSSLTMLTWQRQTTTTSTLRVSTMAKRKTEEMAVTQQVQTNPSGGKPQAEVEEDLPWIQEKAMDLVEFTGSVTQAIPGPRVGSSSLPWILALPLSYASITFVIAFVKTVRKFNSPKKKRKKLVSFIVYFPSVIVQNFKFIESNVSSALLTALDPYTSFSLFARLDAITSLFVSLDPVSLLKSYQQACRIPCWQEAMDLELNALVENDTWDMVPTPSNTPVIGCHWVYSVKLKSDGSIDRYKARLLLLSSSFKMKDLGPITYFLRLEVHYFKRGYFVNQHKYVQDLIKLTNLTDDKKVDTPVEVNVKYFKRAGERLSDPTIYRQFVGSLIYLTMTRPDISYAVHIVSQFVSSPYQLHLTAAHSIICYLREPTPLYANNTSASRIASNPVFHERTKHIEVDCHFICDKYLNNLISLPYIASTHQIADIFTKAMSSARHCFHGGLCMAEACCFIYEEFISFFGCVFWPLYNSLVHSQTGFDMEDILRKYIRYAMNERPFNADLVADLIQLRKASMLDDATVAEILNEISRRIMRDKGPVVMDISGYTEKGLKRKLAVRALFGKVLYLSELPEFCSRDSSLVVKEIFGVTDEDVDTLRIHTFSEAGDMDSIQKMVDGSDPGDTSEGASNGSRND
ncbi:uncharacterized protein LOC122079717 [Macadamia integrifolia]|uniref:uncharacterized protein LOC122079717 n=1 Tax=Macadamia integrifolia TaxID=60698 RepID=UPI001C4E4D3B|nr:uncharacterized protein LOC122079717 [Macadamia integrifolia]